MSEGNTGNEQDPSMLKRHREAVDQVLAACSSQSFEFPLSTGVRTGNEQDLSMLSRRAEAADQVLQACNTQSFVLPYSMADYDMRRFYQYLQSLLPPTTDTSTSSDGFPIPDSSERPANMIAVALTFTVNRKPETYCATQDTISYIRSQIQTPRNHLLPRAERTEKVGVSTAQDHLYGELDLGTVQMVREKLEEDTRGLVASIPSYS